MTRTKPSEQGMSLAELLVVLTVLALLLTATVPSVLRASSSLRVRLAAAEVATALYLARSEAVRLGHHVGLRFDRDADGRVTFTLFADGDGDGLSSRDIRAGKDAAVSPPRRLGHLGRAVRFGFPEAPPARDPSGRRLDRLGDPVRFNRSDLASFSPLGTSTPGSVYLTDGRRALVAVRLLGTTGRVRVTEWDPEAQTWRR